LGTWKDAHDDSAIKSRAEWTYLAFIFISCFRGHDNDASRETQVECGRLLPPATLRADCLRGRMAGEAPADLDFRSLLQDNAVEGGKALQLMRQEANA
jgi:hypothetical protein